MTDYNNYRSIAGITTKQMVDVVAAEFPKFSKIQCSMCSNPAYGVCLVPEAEELLVEAFGNAPGLSISNKPKAQTMERKPEKRRKRYRLTVRLDDTTAMKLRELMTEMHYTHAQDFLEQAIISIIENWEAGT